MAKKSRSPQITAAVIGVIGVLGAAIIANWDKIFPPEPPPNGPTVNPRDVERGGENDLKTRENHEIRLVSAKREAEKLTAEWFEAFEAGNVDTLVRLSRPPFFFDNEILMSESDINIRYRTTAERSGDRESTRVDRIMSGTIREFKDLGYIDEARDRMMGRMKLNENDIAVFLVMKGEGIGFYFRRREEGVEMVGFWD
ncbi:hypothetical protein GWN42_22720 [candidate division KSB1 bacterium]|nr:hypothetical protein [Phycisphaerae bacterium]NIV95525.1 hypothetical protein [candidate division KSB1 bacterium]